jgi:transposase InsO family protein
MSTYKWICWKGKQNPSRWIHKWKHLSSRDDIDTFNRKLMDYLIWYYTKRPHKSLNNLTPIEILSNIIRSFKCM